MRARDIYKMLAGACVIYVALAACNASKPGGGHSNSNNSRGSGGGGVTDPVPSAKADPASGSRLKAKYRVGDDGSKEYLAGVWYDAERQEDCTFATGADGKEHCMPTSQVTVTFYADSMCKKPLAVGTAACAPKYAVNFEPSSCSATVARIYSIGAQMTPSNLYVNANGTCFNAGSPDANAVYYEVGAEVPPSSFVASSLQHDK